MVILALDTSTGQASVALMRDGDVRAELSWTSAGNHSRLLTASVRQLLELENVVPRDLSAVVVASGPGSFSGLRVGLSEAKGFSLGLDVPLVGISTLDAIALQASGQADEILSVLPAGRGRVYVARYTGGWNELRRVSDYQLSSVADIARSANGALIAGEGAVEIAHWREANALPIWCEPSAFRLRRAGFLAELGKRYLDAGGTDQRDSLEPLYLRKSAAEEKRDQSPE